jgi:hypothetical protein
MVKITSPKAYKVVRYILEKGKFNQLETSASTGVSIGMVNRVTKWLIERGYAARSNGGYELIMPAALLTLFPVYRRMEGLAGATFKLGISEKELSALLKKHKAVLCLTSASQYYDQYIRDPSLHVYSESSELKAELGRYASGLTAITIYSPDIPLEGDTETKKGFFLTTELRTMIDLLCSNKAYAAESMIRKRWKK